MEKSQNLFSVMKETARRIFTASKRLHHYESEPRATLGSAATGSSTKKIKETKNCVRRRNYNGVVHMDFVELGTAANPEKFIGARKAMRVSLRRTERCAHNVSSAT